MLRILITIFCLTVLQHGMAQIDSTRKWGDWKTWGDQGNRTYMNPILPGDYSDLDCIRVGDISMRSLQLFNIRRAL